MLAVERRNLILEKLQEDRKVVVSELSTLFDVSEETIRRDLDKLDREGLAIRRLRLWWPALCRRGSILSWIPALRQCP